VHNSDDNIINITCQLEND